MLSEKYVLGNIKNDLSCPFGIVKIPVINLSIIYLNIIILILRQN